MNEKPNYSEYSLYDLQQVLKHIDRERHPERVKEIIEQIQIKEKLAKKNGTKVITAEIQRVGVLKTFFSFQGRADRTSYWIVTITSALFSLLLLSYEDELFEIFEYFWLLKFLILWVVLAVTVKRWHDRNKPAAWLLLNIIPFINLWALVENGFLEGDEEVNKYGNPQAI